MIEKQRKDDERARDLLKAISDIEEEMILEAGFENTNIVPMNKKNVSLKKWVPVAACFVVLLIALVPFLSNQFSKSSTHKSSGEVTESVDESVEMKAYSKISDNETSNYTSDIAFASIKNLTQDEDITIEVIFNNEDSDENYLVSPKFELYKVDDSGDMENVVFDESKIAFIEVIYELPAKGTCTVSYEINHLLYDISEAGNYRIVLFYQNEDCDEHMTTYCNFEIS